MRFLWLFFLVHLTIAQSAFAQNKKIENAKNKVNHSMDDGKKKIKEKSQYALGGFLRTDIKEPTKVLGLSGSLNSNGWGIGVSYGKIKTKNYVRWFTLSLSEIKHDKEEKIKPNTYEVQGYGRPLPYIYGKQNSFYSLGLGYSQQRILIKGFIAPSANVSLVYGANLSVGFLKPYYLKIKHLDNNVLHIENEKYSISNADSFLTNNKIYSRSSFGYGLSETKVIPGINFHLGTQIDIGSSNWIKAIRIGTSTSFYLKKLQILAGNSQEYYFANLSISIILEKSW